MGFYGENYYAKKMTSTHETRPTRMTNDDDTA